MNVLFVSHNASRTGAPIALLQEIRFLRANYTEIVPEVLFLAGGELCNEFSSLCKVYVVPPISLLRRVTNRLEVTSRDEKPWIKKFKPGRYDCVYANTVVSIKTGLELKRRLGIPLIAHVHEAELAIETYGLNEETASAIDHYIVVSHLVANYLTDSLRVTRERISIQPPISTWVERYLNGQQSVTPYVSNSGIPLVGCFLNDVYWWKSSDLFPAVLRCFFEKHPETDCKFAIVGRMSEEVQRLMAFDLRKAGVCNHVVWIGEVENPLSLHARFDILLLPSREESFSLVAQEAALFQTPVVGFHGATGIEEWLGEQGGRWVPYLDIEALADALYEFVADGSLREHTGIQGRRIIEEMYRVYSPMSDVVRVINTFKTRN